MGMVSGSAIQSARELYNIWVDTGQVVNLSGVGDSRLAVASSGSPVLGTSDCVLVDLALEALDPDIKRGTQPLL